MEKKIDISRRKIIKSAAWSLPVIAAAVATPLAAASQVPTQKYPVSCKYLGNHGHGGDTSNDWWFITYSDGSTETLDNGTVMRNKALKEICKK